MNSIRRMIFRVAAVAAAVFSVASCGLYGKYRPVEDPVTVKIPTFREVFTDPLLQELIDTALVRNTDLKMAHERVRQAESNLTAAKLAYLPRLFAGGDPAVTFQSTAGGIEIGRQKTWTYGFGSASWEIDIFGRLTNQKRIAGMSLEQAADFEQAARVELVAAVASVYFNLQMLDAQIAAADSAEVNWAGSVETMRRLKECGQNDEAAVAQFEGAYYATRVMAAQLRLTRHKAENEMRTLLFDGESEIRRAPLPMTAGAHTVNKTALDSIDLRALRVRPDVKAAEKDLAKAFYNVNLSRANCCPSIGISGSVGWAGEGLIFSAVGGLLQPLFNAGQNVARLRVSKSQFEEMKLNYAKALFVAGNQANNAIASCKSHISRTDDCLNRVNSMKRALAATRLKMELGKGTYLEVLTAQNDLLDAQFSAIQNFGDALISYVELYHVLGGGKF